ncbi:DDE-type integrase/transposase/recombinase [Saccharothrix syringae]|uniref:Integrase catalytic domain-containing protein n=1 Tax=Saccharothrix syringae TaxID=103733 RepID=A0A5Q0HG44_SACSY|nr:hypothetical protein EKG83_31820 [Saccharothrix syringae]
MAPPGARRHRPGARYHQHRQRRVGRRASVDPTRLPRARSVGIRLLRLARPRSLAAGSPSGTTPSRFSCAATPIKGLPNRRRPRPKHDTPTAADLVDRDFARAAPGRLWVTDITEHPTREGKVYCAVVLDVHSRRVVGWPIDSSQTAALATNALGMAISNRSPLSDTVIHYDHGVQFTSWTFTKCAKESGLLSSTTAVDATPHSACSHRSSTNSDTPGSLQ